MKSYEYEARVTWTGNTGDGTSRYESYGRDHEISHPADPDFRGDPRRYSLEDPRMASHSGRHMLWYLH